MKKQFILFAFCLIFGTIKAQNGYDISINIKNYPDSIAYLTFYQFDKTYIKDTCSSVKNGKIIFKGKTKLNTGIYSLVGQQKNLYFDFIIDDTNQKIEIDTEFGVNMIKSLSAKNTAQQNDFFNYIRMISSHANEFEKTKQQARNLSKTDSITKILAKKTELDNSLQEYESRLIENHKQNYLSDFLNLKTEKKLKNVPLASNGRPDSIAAFRYYKNHYWDNVNFKNDAILRNPLFFKKLKTYFENTIAVHPDTITSEIDKMLLKTTHNSVVNKTLISYFTYSYEISKILGHDKVFVHMADTYFKTGKANDVYDDHTAVGKIIKKADRIRPLLIGAKAPELLMIQAKDRDKIAKLGIEKATTSEEVTKLYYANESEIKKLYYKLSDIKADYLIMAFWDVDCGHCVAEIPKLLNIYNDFQKENKDVKVMAIYTQFDGDKWLKHIDQQKLDWINVYDGAHINNIPEKYDVYTTPVIYLLDKNKIIKAKKIGIEQIKDFIKIIEKETAK